MPTPRDKSIWGNIRVQLNTVQKEILNGQYRESMILNQEILKTIVRLQVDKACLVSESLEQDIDQLFEGRYISKKTQDHYHAIVSYAKEAEEGSSVSAQAANESFSLIREELEAYVDANQRTLHRSERESNEDMEPESREADAESTAADATASMPEDTTVASRVSHSGAYADAPRIGGLDIPIDRSRDRSTSNGRSGAGTDRAREMRRSVSGSRTARTARTSGRPSRPVRSSDNARSAQAVRRQTVQGQRRRGSSGNRRSDRNRQTSQEIDLYRILRVLIPVACVLLFVILIRVLMSGGSKVVETTAAASTEQQTMATIAETTVPETTEPETTAAISATWVTTAGVRVRTAPSTDNSQVLDVLDPDTEITYKGDYDTEWIIIDYNGQDAYISKQYAKPKESAATTASAAATGAGSGSAASGGASTAGSSNTTSSGTSTALSANTPTGTISALGSSITVSTTAAN
ncbi:SH3 domain-containing protein [Oribacterium sp. HCP28S3_H8]|uniref:SH3 domain-containing protein n=1 Tax=Oribacterium sp. HCP28S3_H8 TaxID=3438945 RepID=UPI003F8BC324